MAWMDAPFFSCRIWYHHTANNSIWKYISELLAKWGDNWGLGASTHSDRQTVVWELGHAMHCSGPHSASAKRVTNMEDRSSQRAAKTCDHARTAIPPMDHPMTTATKWTPRWLRTSLCILSMHFYRIQKTEMIQTTYPASLQTVWHTCKMNQRVFAHRIKKRFQVGFKAFP